MRNAFFAELLELFEQNSKVVFITGDLGFKLFDSLKEIDADRVINFGIREGGMIGFASGLANRGFLPFVYSIVPFITLRCLEQIKLDLCYNKAKVVVVGVGGGFAYGPNGPTHHGIEDVGMLCKLPGMTVWTPSDPLEVRVCVRTALSSEVSGPAYLRLGRNGEPSIHESEEDCSSISQPQVIRDGADGTIVTNGALLYEVVKSADLLANSGIYCRIVQLSTMKPFPSQELMSVLVADKPVLSVEEHVKAGGLGQKVATLMAENALNNRFGILAIPDRFADSCNDQQALLKWAGLDANSISKKFIQLCASQQ